MNAIEQAEAVVREVFGDEEVRTLTQFNPANVGINDFQGDYEQRPWLPSEMLDQMIEKETPFEVVAVRHSPAKGDRKPTYYVDLNVGNEEYTKSFAEGWVTKRDLLLAGLHDHFKEGENAEPWTARFRRAGRAVLIVPV